MADAPHNELRSPFCGSTCKARNQARAQAKIVIEDTLDEGLPRADTPGAHRMTSSEAKLPVLLDLFVLEDLRAEAKASLLPQQHRLIP